MWKVWKFESMPNALISTSWPTFERSVGVLPAYARPLKHWKFALQAGDRRRQLVREQRVARGRATSRPCGRTMIAPNRPRNVFSVWLGPWSWYGQTPTESGVHSHW